MFGKFIPSVFPLAMTSSKLDHLITLPQHVVRDTSLVVQFALPSVRNVAIFFGTWPVKLYLIKILANEQINFASPICLS